MNLLRGTIMVAGGVVAAFAFMAVLPVLMLEIDMRLGPDDGWRLG